MKNGQAGTIDSSVGLVPTNALAWTGLANFRVVGKHARQSLNHYLFRSVHLFPGGHLPMCPHVPSSSITHTSHTRPEPYAYVGHADEEVQARADRDVATPD
jgi:hypothetical protein